MNFSVNKRFIFILIALFAFSASGSFVLASTFPQTAGKISESNFTPSTTTEEVESTSDNAYTESEQPVAQAIQPTTDPDPIVTCNSKTGALQVRASVCQSHTDCPDGYGGFVFESQSACKARWSQISNDLANVVDQYGKAKVEQMALTNQANATSNSQPLPQVAVPTPVSFNPQINLEIKTVVSPTSIPGGGPMHYAGY